MGFLIAAINFLFFYFNVDEPKFNNAISYESRCKDLTIRKSRINYSIFYLAMLEKEERAGGK